MADRLASYRSKRDFSKTSEPGGKVGRRSAGGGRYLIQKHDARRMHFDFRLEHDGVLLSWAVPNGPSYDPADKRLAVHVEDHPLDYGNFEGTIPAGNYGGGTVMLWDEGTWEPIGDVNAGLKTGDLKFLLHGERMRGKWVLVRMKPKRGERSKQENWLLIKERDENAGPEKVPIVERVRTSVRSGRTMEEIAGGDLEWVDGPRKIKRPEPPEGKSSKKTARTAPAKAAEKPPAFVAPQLATLVEAPPDGDQWLNEIKFDGYRAVAAIGGGTVRVYTRTGLDWTDRFRPIVRPLADLPCRSALIDGEAVVHDEHGRSDFGRLQNAIAESKAGIVFYAFDLLALDGEDLRKQALSKRKERLAKLLDGQPRGGPILYSDHVVGHGAEVFARACEMGLEGIVAKRADAPYRSIRSKGWLKIKCGHGQELIVIGWQPSTVRGRPFSSLLVATRDEDRFTYRGKIGTGFGERELKAVWKELERRQVKTAPADDIPASIARKARYVKPELVAEVSFAGWTDDGYVRHGAFKGLRTDKPADEVAHETPPAARKGGAGRHKHKAATAAIVTIGKHMDDGAIEIEGVRVTHPDRVMFADAGITKRALVDYFLSVKDLILPHVAGRPLSLLRFPAGAEGEGFFQKHASPGFPAAFKPITIKEKEAKGQYLYIEDERGLVAAAQMGVLELHIWGSHVTTLERPDRLVFDLDPDESLDFSNVRAAARELRDRLKQRGLKSFPMVTGGKGIHVVAPLKPRFDWDAVKAFASDLAHALADEHPDRYIAEMSKARRRGRIFIDYLRNTRGATAVAPFSPRARRGAPVAWPTSWQALDRMTSAHATTVENAAQALAHRRRDPWAGYFATDQILPQQGPAAK